MDHIMTKYIRTKASSMTKSLDFYCSPTYVNHKVGCVFPIVIRAKFHMDQYGVILKILSQGIVDPGG